MQMDKESREFFETLMRKKTPHPAQEHLQLLIENQLSILKSSKEGRLGRCRWYTEVLEWCTDVYRRNPGAYEQMRGGGCLALPHPDTLVV